MTDTDPLESRALNSLYRNHPGIARGDRWQVWLAGGHAHLPRRRDHRPPENRAMTPDPIRSNKPPEGDPVEVCRSCAARPATVDGGLCLSCAGVIETPPWRHYGPYRRFRGFLRRRPFGR